MGKKIKLHNASHSHYDLRDVLIEQVENTNTSSNGKIKKVQSYPHYVTFSAKLQTAGVPGANGVTYPLPLMKNALLEAMGDFVKEKKFLGELDHPDVDFKNKSKEYVMTRLGMVLYERASHVITDIWFEGNEIWGRVETLSERGGSSLGDKIAGMVTRGIPIGFSFRGLGKKVVKNGEVIVEQFMRIVGYDAVTRPSFKDSWLSKIEESGYAVESPIMESDVVEDPEYTSLLENAQSFGFDFNSNVSMKDILKMNPLLSNKLY